MQKIEGYGKKIGDRQKILAATKRQSGDSRISPDRRYTDRRYWQKTGDSRISPDRRYAHRRYWQQTGDSRISPDRRYADIRYWQQIGDSQETGEYQHIRDMQKIEGCKQKVVDRQKKQTGDSEEIRSK